MTTLELYGHVIRRMRPHLGRLAIAIAGVLLAASTEVLKPWPLKIVIDNVLRGTPLVSSWIPSMPRAELLIAACISLVILYALWGLRTVMTICAVALVSAMPSNRTSIGAALNDTAQEVGTSVGTAIVGTLIAALVTAILPAGRWSADLVASFFHGERITYATLAVIVGVIAGWGALTLTDSRSTEEHPAPELATADATANTNCEIFIIDRREFVPFVRSHPALAMKFIELLCTRLRWTSDQVEQVILQNLPGRLASALIRLTEKYKMVSGERSIAVTQQEISEMVGMTRESINKQLRVWAARSWVRLEHGVIVVLDAEPLQAIAEAGGSEGD